MYTHMSEPTEVLKCHKMLLIGQRLGGCSLFYP